MKKRKIIEILLVIIGIALIIYPIISNYISSYYHTVAITDYKNKIENMTQEEKEKELADAKEYNEGLEKKTIIDLSLNEEKNITNEKKQNASYLNVLNIGDIMAYINIPKLDIYLPIYHGVSEKVLQSGIGHLENTSLPIGGKGTHCVLAGHTGLARTKMFDDLDKLEIGDLFYIYILGEKHSYKVDKIDVVKPNNTDVIKNEEDKEFITLITCTPRILNTYRLLVRGERLEDPKQEIYSRNIYEAELQTEEVKTEDKITPTKNTKEKKLNKTYIGITMVIILIVAIGIFIVKKLLHV